MANRTVQFYGQGYSPAGSTPLTVTAVLNGNTVYSGPISTEYISDIGRAPTDQVILFTAEIPVDFNGTMPMSVTLTGAGDLYLEQADANYTGVINPVYSAADIAVLEDPTSTSAQKLAVYQAAANPPLSPAEIAVLENPSTSQAERNAIFDAHNLKFTVSGGDSAYFPINGENDARTNVTINSIPVTPDHTDFPDATGTWGWEIESTAGNDSTITFDLNVVAGIA